MKIERTLTINAPIVRVWQVVAHDFASVGEWASNVDESVVNINASTPNGATVGGRVCDVPGFGQLEETFIEYDEVGKTFTYDATGLPFFVKHAQNTWKVEAIDEQTTRVSFSADMALIPILGTLMSIPMKRQLITILDNVVEELKYYVEKGVPHPRKVALIQKAQNRIATVS